MSNIDIWQFLGTNKQRPCDKTAMKVKHYDEVPESKKKDKGYYGQVKMDGVYCFVVRLSDGRVGLFSRTGKQFENTYEVESYLTKYTLQQFNPSIYIAELCCDSCSLEVLSGIVNPNRTQPLDQEQVMHSKMMYLAFHDRISILEMVIGESRTPYHERYAWLQQNLPSGLRLLDVYAMTTEDAMDKFFNDVISTGQEGVVYKDVMAGWVAGHKGWRMMKKVRGVNYDLECVGWEEGTGKYKGKVANLIFKWKDGKTVKAMLGKGWSHDDAERMFYNIDHGSSSEQPVGNIFQVYALQESSKGKLRLPKVGIQRFDKEVADV